MLTEKQNEIIEQIKQEFEAHNHAIDLRKKSKSIFGFESIISESQEKEDLIKETEHMNVVNYNVIREKVLADIELLNEELELLGFWAHVGSDNEISPSGRVRTWYFRISKLNAQSNQERNLMSFNIFIDCKKLTLRKKEIPGILQILPTFRYRYCGNFADDLPELFKNDTVKDSLLEYYERFIKNN